MNAPKVIFNDDHNLNATISFYFFIVDMLLKEIHFEYYTEWQYILSVLKVSHDLPHQTGVVFQGLWLHGTIYEYNLEAFTKIRWNTNNTKALFFILRQGDKSFNSTV